MSDDKKFEMPVPDLEGVAFEIVETSLRMWLREALVKWPRDMVLAAITRAAASCSIMAGFEKAEILRLVGATYDVYAKKKETKK